MKNRERALNLKVQNSRMKVDNSKALYTVVEQMMQESYLQNFYGYN
jgi:hypothetical protein